MITNNPITIFIDVSETSVNKLKTGIQRVVREVVNNSSLVSEKINVKVIPVVAYRSSFYKLTNYSPLFDLNQSPVKRTYFTELVLKVLRLMPFYYRLMNKLLRFLSPNFYVVNTYCDPKPIEIRAGDALLMLDSFWSKWGALEAAAKFKKHGGLVVTVIYDLIPITHKNYFEVSLVHNFTEAIHKALELSEGVVAISDAVLDDVKLLTLDKNKGLNSNKAFDFFHLGANYVDNSKFNRDNHNEWPNGLWAKDSVFLMVGTVEPRKGHEFVLDAFEQRWRDGKPGKLLILGKIGWKTDLLIQRIVASPYYGTKLFLFTNASDSELNEAYSKSFACIMASYTEGFGLPVIEALQRGIPVVASDIPVFREVAGEYASYFTINDKLSFNDTLEDLIENYETMRRKLTNFKWLTWADSTEQLLSKVNGMALRNIK